MFKGFKEFAYRGNVIDLAVAVVAGAAIVALVGDFTVAIIEPLIGLVLGGGVDVGVVVVDGQVFDFTLLINSFITFIITLLVIYYALVVPVNRMRRKQEEEEPPAPAEDVVLLTEIRDLLNRS
ncbi:MAG TPA: large conductance mechanosensitive channel protein MscL [Candidatus Nanopelagicales bacterium]|nr:large conductance mechanosensitive channel protein MscL [Candidatus Nanopelagicales bacterium]